MQTVVESQNILCVCACVYLCTYLSILCVYTCLCGCVYVYFICLCVYIQTCLILKCIISKYVLYDDFCFILNY